MPDRFLELPARNTRNQRVLPSCGNPIGVQHHRRIMVVRGRIVQREVVGAGVTAHDAVDQKGYSPIPCGERGAVETSWSAGIWQHLIAKSILCLRVCCKSVGALVSSRYKFLDGIGLMQEEPVPGDTESVYRSLHNLRRPFQSEQPTPRRARRWPRSRQLPCRS